MALFCLSIFKNYLVFDKEGNGFITQDELKKILQSLGEVLSDEEMKEMLKDLNVNTDGTINYEGIKINLIRKITILSLY